METKNGILSVIIVILSCILLAIFCGVVNTGCWAVNVGKGVVDRVVNPDAIVTNYEWYEQQYRDIKAAEGQIKDAKDAIKSFKEDSGPSDKWRFDQREEYARLNSNLQGLKSYKRSLIETYNAKSAMITRNLWKSSTLPHTIDQE